MRLMKIKKKENEKKNQRKRHAIKMKLEEKNSSIKMRKLKRKYIRDERLKKKMRDVPDE